MRRLRVGIDGRAFSSPAAGVRRYVSELVPALLETGAPLELTALGGSAASLPAGVTHVAEPWHPPTNPGWVAVGLPIAAARAGVDLIHAPAYTAPLVAAVPTILTIHDVSYERHPEWYPYRRDGVRRWFYRRSARAAAHVLTDSEFSRREIAAAYDIPADRITVALLGASATFAPLGGAIPLPPGVTLPFVLHVGDLHERRNLPIVARSVIAIRARGALPRLSLVLAGIDRGTGDDLAALAAAAGAPDAILRLGAVSEAALRALYQSASALVYPSRYEGFGLPLLEAMASGTPVVASRAASIPEVVGDAGVLLEPDDVEGWTMAIERLTTDEAERARLRAAGLSRAGELTWARTARITLDAYERTAARPRAAETARA